ncbi:hypothetical protein NKH18_51140 [Streptomyces sp. M10(2022)]
MDTDSDTTGPDTGTTHAVAGSDTTGPGPETTGTDVAAGPGPDVALGVTGADPATTLPAAPPLPPHRPRPRPAYRLAPARGRRRPASRRGRGRGHPPSA